MNVLACMCLKEGYKEWSEAQVKTMGEYQNTEFDAL